MPALSTIYFQVNTRKGLTEPDKRGECRQASLNLLSGFLLIGSGGRPVEKSSRAVQPNREGPGVFARKGLFHLLDCHVVDSQDLNRELIMVSYLCNGIQGFRTFQYR